MIINSKGLGDDSSDATIPDNTYLILLGVVTLFVGFIALDGNKSRVTYRASKRISKSPVKRARARETESANYKLEVDITGNGNWVEQDSGSLAKMKKLATSIKQREGMKTRIT